MLLKQFQSFYRHNFPDSMEQLIEYFSIFGAFGYDIDITQPIEKLILNTILDNYGELYNEISSITLGEPAYQHILSAIAVGDRRFHSACKRAHISEAKGAEIVEYFYKINVLKIEHSREAPPKKLHPKQRLKREVARHRISHKLRFISPFLRFWFYFIAPFHKKIETGNFESAIKLFREQHYSFTGFIFEELSMEMLQKQYLDDCLISAGSYWDRQVELDILAKTKSGKIIVGECKWTNTKINKSELTKLLEKCKTAAIKPDIITLFAKRGFSNELLRMKSDRLQLYSAEDFSDLLH
ncbi:MAG: hypothetical protein B5M52_04905 [Helicobacteraceae bacterium 4484_230]|nr:MAG: hypothetical protein B5M52_04905 [Helicobacteraceae bacterium 4484_230]